MTQFDLILVGGGLANCLIADRVARRRPHARIMILERGARVCGNHTWCYHQTDVTPDQDLWLSRLATATWPDQEVRFPDYRRTLPIGYRALTSLDLAGHIERLASVTVETSAEAQELSHDAVVLADGRRFEGDCILDGRGLGRLAGMALAYQKFVGIEFETEAPHGLVRPIIMDAKVEQRDGFRFVYCLPFTPTRLLVEDTYYSDTPDLDDDRLTLEITRYAAAAGWAPARELRRERGVLPIVLDGELSGCWPARCSLPRTGMRAGQFHQTTGYSLARAATVADMLAGLEPLTSASASAVLEPHARATWAREGYHRLLNRMIFVAARPDSRRQIFERFYKLATPMIGRFYAGRFLARDKVRMMTGRPPVALTRALAAFLPSSAWIDRAPGAAQTPPADLATPSRLS
ncbi:MAG: lycopene beta-cyclase CrtY [Hyphomicrobiaceae bacterium]